MVVGLIVVEVLVVVLGLTVVELLVVVVGLIVVEVVVLVEVVVVVVGLVHVKSRIKFLLFLVFNPSISTSDTLTLYNLLVAEKALKYKDLFIILKKLESGPSTVNLNTVLQLLSMIDISETL